MLPTNFKRYIIIIIYLHWFRTYTNGQANLVPSYSFISRQTVEFKRMYMWLLWLPCTCYVLPDEDRQFETRRWSCSILKKNSVTNENGKRKKSTPVRSVYCIHWCNKLRIRKYSKRKMSFVVKNVWPKKDFSCRISVLCRCTERQRIRTQWWTISLQGSHLISFQHIAWVNTFEIV